MAGVNNDHDDDSNTYESDDPERLVVSVSFAVSFSVYVLFYFYAVSVVEGAPLQLLCLLDLILMI